MKLKAQISPPSAFENNFFKINPVQQKMNVKLHTESIMTYPDDIKGHSVSNSE